jgi:hypothetical protein
MPLIHATFSIARANIRCDDALVIRARSLISAPSLCFLVTLTALAQIHSTQSAAIPVPAATPQELRPSPQDIYSTQPTLTLIQHTPDAHPGNVWLRSSPDGLHVWVKVQADQQGFRWPAEKSEMFSSDHIELWLAAAPDVPMPLIAWGNQFGVTTLHSEKDCQDQSDSHTGNAADGVRNCLRWYLNFFAISPQGEILSALNIDQGLSGQGGEPEAADLTITPDWQRITAFFDNVDYSKDNGVSNWTSTTYCLTGHVYKQCATDAKATPPEPAHFPDLRNGDD